MNAGARILLISGSLREGSTNTALLRTAEALAPDGVSTVRYLGMAELPHFNPDDDVDPLPTAVVELRTAIEVVDALLFCTPEYAGALPGSLKNLLDWTVGGGQTYGKPVAWVNVSAMLGADNAYQELRTVLGYTGAEIVEPACVRIPLRRDQVGPDGIVDDREIRDRLAEVLRVLRAHLRAT